MPDHHEPGEGPAREGQAGADVPDGAGERERLGWDTATDWPDRPDVTRADGRTEVHHDAGQSVVHEGGGHVTVTDGDVSVRSSSEGVQISHPGGDITVDSKGRLTGVPDDAVVVKGRRRTWTLETGGPDPIRVSRDADGVVTVSHGDTTVRELKGVTVADAGDGLYTKAYPDGTTQVTQVDAAGGSTTLFDDGSTLHRYPDGAFEIYGDPGLKHGAHDYDGTVDPSAGLSESGLTHNGKLDDQAHVPDAIQNLVDKGVVSIDEKGVVRVNQKVTESFTLPETAESYRQVGLQERGMNDLTQYIREKNMDARADDKSWGKADIARYRREAEQHLTDYFQGEGLPPDKARSLAKDTLAHHEALHGPDRVIGGNPDNLTGFGKDTTPGNTVNSAMGRHWASGDAVREFNRRMNDAFQDIPEDLRGDVRVNTEFQVNNKTANFTGLP